MKYKTTPWTAEEDAALARAVAEKVSPLRLSVRLQRTAPGIKRRMRDLGINGTARDPRVAKALALVRACVEACRKGNLIEVMQFYDAGATLECACAGPAVYAGAGAIEGYWQPKLSSASPQRFLLERASFENDHVVVDYLSHEAKPVRMFVRFDEDLKISQSKCAPRGCSKAVA